MPGSGHLVIPPISFELLTHPRALRNRDQPQLSRKHNTREHPDFVSRSLRSLSRWPTNPQDSSGSGAGLPIRQRDPPPPLTPVCHYFPGIAPWSLLSNSILLRFEFPAQLLFATLTCLGHAPVANVQRLARTGRLMLRGRDGMEDQCLNSKYPLLTLMESGPGYTQRCSSKHHKSTPIALSTATYRLSSQRHQIKHPFDHAIP